MLLEIGERQGEVVLGVSDTGPGLSEGDRAKMFQKFARLSAKPTAGETSTGLGLFIVYNLIRATGGRIECESLPGQGAKFIVRYPVGK